MNPNNASVLNYYGYMLADRGVRLEEATSMIQRAVTQEPSNGAYLDSLGWAYYKQNKLTEAEENLRKAVERQSHDPTILGHLGDVYAKLGQPERAATYWERALTEWQKASPADYDPDQSERAGCATENVEAAHGAKNHAGFGETAVSSPHDSRDNEEKIGAPARVREDQPLLCRWWENVRTVITNCARFFRRFRCATRWNFPLRPARPGFYANVERSIDAWVPRISSRAR